MMATRPGRQRGAAAAAPGQMVSHIALRERRDNVGTPFVSAAQRLCVAHERPTHRRWLSGKPVDEG